MKKIFTLLSTITMMLALSVCFSASAAEEKVVIDNVVYELTSQKYSYDSLDYGEHYAVTDFIEDETLAETTTKINIVDEIDGIEVKAIVTNFDEHDGDEIHYERYNQKYPSVTKVSIPGTVRYISDFAFTFFPSVEKLYFPAELERIGFGAFEGMESLKSITLPAGVTYIPDRAFRRCINLEKVVIHGDITSIGDSAFSDCEKLASFDFKDTIKYLGDSCFSGTAITKAVIPENVETGIEGGAFWNCSKLEKIVFENTSDEKEDYVTLDCYDDFGRCNNVKAVYIKTIPTKTISFNIKTSDDMPLLKDIYFAGSEEKWNALTYETDRDTLEARGVKIHFLYRHNHNYTLTDKEATCSEIGKEIYSCECGKTKTYTYSKDADNHISDKWTIVTNPTLTKEGTKKGYCNICKKNVTLAIAKLKLDTPENLKATQSSSVIRLTWNSVESATGYRIYQFNEETEKYEKIASVKGKTVYRVTGLEQGKKYMFKVKAYIKDKDENIGWSKASSALKTGTEPGKVKITSATVLKNGKVKLTWTSAGEDVYYSIYYSLKKNGYETSTGWTNDLSAEVNAYGNPSYVKVYAYGVIYDEDGSRRVDITPETKIYDVVKVTYE